MGQKEGQIKKKNNKKFFILIYQHHTSLQVLLLKSVSKVKATVDRTLLLASSYAFNAPTLNDCSTHSLLETLPLLSQAVSLENKEDKRTVLLPTRLSFQDHGRKKIGHMKEREKEGSSFLCGTLPKSQESHMCQDFFCLSENSGLFFRCTCCIAPLFSKVTAEAGRQNVWHQFPSHFWQDPHSSNEFSL